MANALTLNGNGRCRSASAIDLSSATSLISIEIEGNFPKDIGNNQPLVAQWEGDQSSDNNFIFRVETVGELRTTISADGNHVTGLTFDSTNPLPRPVNAIKVEIDLASQIIRYYYGDTVGGTYTQLGSNITGTGVTSLRSSSLLWDIGYTHNVAPAWTTTGSVKRVRVIADAVTVIDIDFSTASEGDTTVAATTGPNWTLSETAAIWDVTTNLGLATPSSDYIAQLWANDKVGSVIGDVWDYNQTVLGNFIGSREWIDWDPTPLGWGGGTSTGKYIKLPGDVIMAYGRHTAGTTFATGNIFVLLPVDPDYAFLTAVDIIGQAQAFDNSSTSGKQTGACYLLSNNTIRFVNEGVVGGEFWNVGIGAMNPFGWAINDSIAFNVIYKGVPS